MGLQAPLSASGRAYERRCVGDPVGSDTFSTIQSAERVAANNTRPSSANSSDAVDATTTSYNGSLIFVELEEQIDERLAILNVPMPSASQPTVDIFSLRYWDPFLLKVNEDLGKYSGELQSPEVCEREIFKMRGGRRHWLFAVRPDKREVADERHFSTCQDGLSHVQRLSGWTGNGKRRQAGTIGDQPLGQTTPTAARSHPGHQLGPNGHIRLRLKLVPDLPDCVLRCQRSASRL